MHANLRKERGKRKEGDEEREKEGGKTLYSAAVNGVHGGGRLEQSWRSDQDGVLF